MNALFTCILYFHFFSKEKRQYVAYLWSVLKLSFFLSSLWTLLFMYRLAFKDGLLSVTSEDFTMRIIFLVNFHTIQLTKLNLRGKCVAQWNGHNSQVYGMITLVVHCNSTIKSPRVRVKEYECRSYFLSVSTIKCVWQQIYSTYSVFEFRNE